MTEHSDIVAWLNDEQRKAERWIRPASGVLRFLLTGPEFMRIRQALDTPTPPRRRVCTECDHVFSAADLARENVHAWGHPCFGAKGVANGGRVACESHRVDELARHRCSGCDLRWDGKLHGAELCGDCWRKAQPVVHAAENLIGPIDDAASAIVERLKSDLTPEFVADWKRKYGGTWDEDTTATIVDELWDRASAVLSRPAPVCKTCNGSGFVAYMTHAGSAEGEGCPDCDPSRPTEDGTMTDETEWRELYPSDSDETIRARQAVSTLRDFAREHGMSHHQRDPLVAAIHKALDGVVLSRSAQEPTMTPKEELQEKVKLATPYVNQIVVESDGYPEHSANAVLTLPVNAFIQGFDQAIARSRSAQEPPKEKELKNGHESDRYVSSESSSGRTDLRAQGAGHAGAEHCASVGDGSSEARVPPGEGYGSARAGGSDGVMADAEVSRLAVSRSRAPQEATTEEREMARGFISLWDSIDVQDADDWLYVLRNRAELLLTPAAASPSAPEEEKP